MRVVYIDSVFLLNFLINYLLLLVTAKICGASPLRLRLCAGAAVGAVYAVLCWVPGLQWLGGLVGKLVFAAAMAAAGFLRRRSRGFLRLMLVFWAVSLALGGGVYAVGLLVYGQGSPGGAVSLPIDFKTLLLTAAISYALLTLVFRRAAQHGPQELETLRVVYCGRSHTLRALLDSGHTLRDPLSGAAVAIVDRTSAEEILDTVLPPGLLEHPTEALSQGDSAIRWRLIPYKTVGVEQGFLLAFRPQMVYLGRQQATMLVAVSPHPVSDGGGYQALISAQL